MIIRQFSVIEDIKIGILRKFHSVINRSACLVYSLHPRNPTTPYLIKIHYHPIKARIEFKSCFLAFEALRFGDPKYLVVLLPPFDRDISVDLPSGNDPYGFNEAVTVYEHCFAKRSLCGSSIV